MLKRVIFIRHGERSDLAPPDRQIPHDILYDPPLTELGHQQSIKASNFLATLLSTATSIRLVSSPMIRCIQTISYLAKKLQKKIYLQDGFGESFVQDYGDVFSRLYSRHCREVFPVEAQYEDEESVLRPKSTENIEEAAERMRKMKELYFGGVNEEILVICTHLYAIWGFCLENGDGYDERNAGFTQICEYEFEGGRFRLVRSGVTEHLVD